MAWSQGSGARFSKTHWSVVLTARDLSSTHARTALEQLCQTYRPPIYAFLRYRGFSQPDAEDMAQAFFAHLLAQPFLDNVQPFNGLFRTFLLTSLERFLVNEWKKQRSQKRGGGATPVPLESIGADFGGKEPADSAPSTHAFDREWALAVVRRVFEDLRADYQQAGKAALFDELHRYIIDGDEPQDALSSPSGSA